MSAETETPVTLYRIENPNIPVYPERYGDVSHPDLVGQWFSPNLDSVMPYLKKSTQTFGKDAMPVRGARLVLAEVNPDELERFHVSRNETASGMDVEDDNYLIPRDGSITTEEIDLDEILEGLHGRLGRLQELMEARRRIVEKVGEVALQKQVA